MRNLYIKYIGENSTNNESDIELTELQEFNDQSWIMIRRDLEDMVKQGILCAFKKNKILKLTQKGRTLYEKILDETPKRAVALKAEVKEVIKPKEVVDGTINMKRLHFKIGDDIKVVAAWKVGELNNAESIEIVGGCSMSTSQDKYYSRWESKISNWSTYPRK